MVVAETQLEIEQLSFRFPDEPNLTLAGIDLAVREGEFIVICGPSGSGKTTFLRHLKRELTPVGTRNGRIAYYGRSLYEYPLSELSPQIGMVMQDPEHQIVMDDVMHELVFGMENLGWRTDVMRRRAAEIVPFFGMEPWMHRKLSELSGGQKQIVNLASVLALQPKLLLLDEPTAQLDPVSSRDLLQMLRMLNREMGLTVILSEHRLDEVVAMCDRMLFMDRGEVVFSGDPRDVLRRTHREGGERLGHFVPSIPRMALMEEAHGRGGRPLEPARAEAPEQAGVQGSAGTEAAGAASLPLTVREGREWAAGRSWKAQPDKVRGGADPGTSLTCEGLWVQYDRNEPLILKHCSFSLDRGDFLALLGGNGSGKSTLLKAVAGLIKPLRGKLKWTAGGDGANRRAQEGDRPEVGYAPQDPMLFFAHDTVEKELYHAAVRRSPRDIDARIVSAAAKFGLEAMLKRHPYDLSGGERQKTMLACMVLSEPEVFLLDEPTKGLDPAAKAELGALLARLNMEGRTVLMATHDLEFAAAHAKRCAMLFDGAITSEGDPRSFFSRNVYYTTAVNRVMRTWLPKAVLPEDVFPCE